MPASFKPAVELLESRSLLSTLTGAIAPPHTTAEQVQTSEAMMLFSTTGAARVQTLNSSSGLTATLPGSSVSNIAPNLLPQNALPGAIFGDGTPNLLLQGNLGSADFPSIRIPGRIAASYEGSGGAGPLEVNGPSSSRTTPVSAISQEDVDEAFVDPFSAEIIPN